MKYLPDLLPPGSDITVLLNSLLNSYSDIIDGGMASYVISGPITFRTAINFLELRNVYFNITSRASASGPVFRPTTTYPTINYFKLSRVLMDAAALPVSPISTVFDYSNMSYFRFEDTWIFSPNSKCFSGAGRQYGAAPYYGTWDGCYLGGIVGVDGYDLGVASSGPNSNTISRTRFQCGTGVKLSRYSQNWVIGNGCSFESCGTGIDTNGEMIVINDGNRFESCLKGIVAGSNSSGKIGLQYYSGVGRTITLNGDATRWKIDW